VLLAGSAALAGCAGPHPFVRSGDADHVEVIASGDPAAALPLATEYCARYERVPRFDRIDLEIVRYDCVRR